MTSTGQSTRKRRKTPHTTRWTQVRSQGKTHFVWYYGVLGVGLPIAIFKIVFDLSNKTGGFPILSILLNLILLPMLGMLIGYLTWTFSERSYKKRQTRRDSTQIGKVV